MVPKAEAYRARARHLASIFAAANDEQLRAMSSEMTRAYEQLAKNEEWLEGEIAPHANSRATAP